MNPQATIVAKDGTKLDASVVNLAKAIRTVESGGNYDARGASGEHGAYQWMPGNYEAGAKKYGIATTDKSPINQDKVAYNTLKEWKDQGLTPAQIAAKWNSGSSTGWEKKVGTNEQGIKYDVPAYVGNVINAFRAVKSGQEPIGTSKPQPGGPDEPQEAPEGYKPWFQAGENDNPLVAGAKALGNVIPSAFNFGKNMVSALNPVKTLETLGQIPGAFSALAEQRGGALPALGAVAKEVPGALGEFVPSGTRQLFFGDLAGAQKAFTEDPFGQVAPYAFLAKPAARGVDTLRSRAAMADYTANLEQNVRARMPIPKPITTAETAVESAVTGIARPVMGVARSVFGRATEAVSREPVLPAKVAGKIVRGATTAEQEIAARVLPKIDTAGVKTYSDLSGKLQSRITEDLAKVDKEYAKSKTRTKLAKLKTTVESDVGGVKASAQINYVEEALKGLQELYFKTKDPASLARIKAVAEQARRQGLTADQINRIAREYGTEFGKKAFSKGPDQRPLTSVNAQMFENIRSGVKDTARGFLKTDAAKALDKGIGEMIKVKKMVDEVVEKVNALEQRITKRNLVQKITHAAGSAFETVTGGAISTLFTKVFLRSNIGMKEMNFFETEAQLAKNLATLKKLVAAELNCMNPISPAGPIILGCIPDSFLLIALTQAGDIPSGLQYLINKES